MDPHTESTAKQIREKLSEVKSLVHEVENARGQTEHDWNKLELAKKEIAASRNGRSIRKLSLAYTKVKNNSKQEERTLRKTLEKIHEIRKMKNDRRLEARSAGNKEAMRRGTLMKMLIQSAQTLPLYVGETPGAKPPPLCGATPAEPNHIAKFGDMVAASVSGIGNERNWILAEVISYDTTNLVYEVEDVDEEDKQKYTVPLQAVVPLPIMRANPETDAHALFPEGEKVKALYPQTTCFYNAVIKAQPEKGIDDYEVLFEDETSKDGFSLPMKVPQRYIFKLKHKKTKTKAD